jgi:hypothetical protein
MLKGNKELVVFAEKWQVTFSSPQTRSNTQQDNISVLTPSSKVLLEKLTGLQLVKKFPAFYGTRMFITASTCARHLSPS